MLEELSHTARKGSSNSSVSKKKKKSKKSARSYCLIFVLTMVCGNVYIVFHATEFLAIINEKYSSVYDLSVVKQVTSSAEISSRSEVRKVSFGFFFGFF